MVERKSLTGFLKCESETEVGDKIPPDNPYGSLDALLKAEVGVDEEEIVSEYQKYRDNPSADKVGAPVGHKGRNEHSANGSKTTISKQDRGKSYLLRRMARDFPETLNKLEAGEYKSTRQAYRTSSLARIWL